MQRTVTHSACSRCSRLVCCCSLQLQRATLAALAAPLLKLSNWTHCVLVCNSDLCCHGQDHCKVNYALARRATQGKSQHVAVVRVRCTRPTNASRAAFRPLASAPNGLDAYDATRPRRARVQPNRDSTATGALLFNHGDGCGHPEGSRLLPCFVAARNSKRSQRKRRNSLHKQGHPYLCEQTAR